MVLTKAGSILGPIATVLGYVMDILFRFTSSFGVFNVGLCIILFTIVMKTLMIPLTIKQQKTTKLMSVMNPEIQAIQKKYKGKSDQESMQRQNVEIQAVYEKYGTSMTGGCLPLLIQMPIIIAMFRFFPASIELRGQHFLWADDLSSYDSVLSLPFNIPFYGDHVSLFALLMTVALFAFSYINYQQTASSQPQMAGMKFMMVYLMPVMMLLWFNSYSSGLTYYYFLANILTIGQTLVIRRMIDDEKIHAVMQANAAKNKNRKKSKFQLRYEELLRQQEEAQRNASRRK